jgi:NAD(P)-dependent dehydrogenase (short-subunit alcohol dehydrogenase family)
MNKPNTDSDKRIALVTGANRGLGLETSRQLAQKGIHVIMASRDPEKGKAAVQKLQSEKLDVSFLPIDISNDTSVDQAFTLVSKDFGHVDIIVNNAGIYADEAYSIPLATTPIEVIRTSLETNTYGPIRIIQKFMPLLKKSKAGRIVNVSSGMGQLAEMNGGSPAYRLSKTALNAVTRIAADELKSQHILVNSVCPGWVKTDMGGPEAELTPPEGADTIVWLATLPEGGPTGGFYRERKPIAW